MVLTARPPLLQLAYLSLVPFALHDLVYQQDCILVLNLWVTQTLVLVSLGKLCLVYSELYECYPTFVSLLDFPDSECDSYLERDWSFFCDH